MKTCLRTFECLPNRPSSARPWGSQDMRTCLRRLPCLADRPRSARPWNDVTAKDKP
jgi:hypothetical protein